MPKCDFKKAAKQLYWNTLHYGGSAVNLLHIFREPFPKKISGLLLLKNLKIRLASLVNSRIWLKVQSAKYLIDRHIENQISKIKKKHAKKLEDVKLEIPNCGIKHGIAVRPSKSEMVAIAENIWDQIERNDLCQNLMKKERVKTALRWFSSTLNLISFIRSLSMIRSKQKC